MIIALVAEILSFRGIVIYVVLITIEERLNGTDDGFFDSNSSMNDKWHT